MKQNAQTFLGGYRFALALAAVTLHLAPAATAATPLTWAESYGVGSFDSEGKASNSDQYSSGADVPRAMAAMPDGGFIVVGDLDLPKLWRSGDAHPAACMVRFAADGTIIWQHTLRQLTAGSEPVKAMFLNDVKTDSQGNIFVTGGKNILGSNVPFVAKFSPASELIWQNGLPKTKGKVAYLSPTNIIDYEAAANPAGYMSLTNDGGVLVPLSQTRPLGYTTYGLAKFNNNGSLGFYRVYEGQHQYAPVGPACQSLDGSRYVMATPYALSNHPQAGAVNGTLLIVTDPSGNIIAQHGFPSLAAAEGYSETPVALIRTADGGFASLAVRAADAKGLMLRKFNADVSVASLATDIVYTPRFASFVATSLAQTADGGFLIGGHTPGGASGEDIALIKVSAAGALEFVSLVGGPKAETNAVAIPASDGGYAFVSKTLSYNTGIVSNHPDWWVVKTDANRRVRNFSGNMTEQSLADYIVSNSGPQTPQDVSALREPDYTYAAVVSAEPQFILENPDTFEAPDQPNFQIQASGPRIISSPTAVAIINQHFGVPVVAAFFGDGAPLTYSAAGLPQGFAIDPNTGIIYGVARPGSETTTPFVITVQATNGTETATGTLQLTISVGAPVFRVNGADKPTGETLIDKPLQFTADYAGRLAGQKVTVQASIDGSTWNDLATGLAGFMTFDASQDRYVLNTTNYPQASAVRFRVRVVVPSRSDVFSNEVGSFNLASSKARAGQTVFRLDHNGLRADYDFRAAQVSPAPGVALRVQSSYSPGVEGSWTDITNSSGSNVSAMKTETATRFSLATNSVKADDGVYFRAVAAATGYVDSLSNIVGPCALTSATPPSVTIVTPSSGTDPITPNVLRQNAGGTVVVSISVKATANTYPINALSITFDGQIIGTYNNAPSGELHTVNYETSRLGDHVIEAIAYDDHKVVGRAATARYIRIAPPLATAAKAARASDGNANAATVRREIYSVAKSGGSWDDPTTWKDSRGNPGLPGQYDFVFIEGNQVRLPSSITRVFALSIDGGTVIGPGSLQVGNMLTVGGSGATFSDTVFLFIQPGALCEAINAKDFRSDGSLVNDGTINVHGARGLVGIRDFENRGTINFQKVILPSEQLALGLPISLRAIEAANIKLSGKAGQSFEGPQGKLLAPNGSTLPALAAGKLLSNAGGTLIAPGGAGILGENSSGLISNDGGGLISNDGGGVISNDGGSVISNDGGSLISNDGGGLISNDGGGLIGPNGAGLKLTPGSAAAKGHAATSASSIVIAGGETDLTGIVIEGAVTMEAGVLSGNGLIAGSLTNNGGFISPGHSPGTLTVLGDFQQGANGTLVLEALGAEPGRFDRLQIRGAAALGGTLDVRTIGGFVPLANDPINPLVYSSQSGGFDHVSGNVQLNFGPGGASATLTPNAPNPKSGQPVNIATRLAVQTGDNALFAGFFVTGPAGSSKKVLIRGLGPSVPVPGTLADPLLELHNTDGTTVVNDNWKDGDVNQIPTGFSPSNDKESAIVATLTVGSVGYSGYTAIMKGAHGETGVGLVEVYDLDTVGAAQLANIATRGLVQTGDNVLIGGFIVQGSEPAKMLVRATGPSSGVAGALQDPVLEVHDSNGSVISNDNWRETQESEIAATGIAPNDSREPAVLATLVPGNYTAVVRGANDTIGVAVVEAYNLQ